MGMMRGSVVCGRYRARAGNERVKEGDRDRDRRYRPSKLYTRSLDYFTSEWLFFGDSSSGDGS